MREVISEAIEPVRKFKNKDGIVTWKFEKDDFVSLLFYRYFMNGKKWMPEVILKIYRKSDYEEAIKEPQEGQEKKKLVAIEVKSAYMSKRDYAEEYTRIRQQMDSMDEKTIENKMFSEYVKAQYDKYQSQMGAIFNEIKKDLVAKEKYKQESSGLTTLNLEQSLNDFANMTPEYVEFVLKEIKDKGYIRPALRGPQKGKLIPDMKAINRAVLDPDINSTPQAAAAFIAKQIALTIRPTSLWGGYTGTGFSWMGSMREEWWASSMVEKLGFTRDQIWKEEKPKELKKKLYNAIAKYAEIIFPLLTQANAQSTPTAPEEAPRLDQPTIIDVPKESNMNYRKRIIAILDQKANEEMPVIPSVPVKPKRPSRKSEGVSYEEWEKRLDAVISNKFGIGMRDFPDWNSRDCYEGDASVVEGYKDFKEAQADELGDLINM